MREQRRPSGRGPEGEASGGGASSCSSSAGIASAASPPARKRPEASPAPLPIRETSDRAGPPPPFCPFRSLTQSPLPFLPLPKPPPPPLPSLPPPLPRASWITPGGKSCVRRLVALPSSLRPLRSSPLPRLPPERRRRRLRLIPFLAFCSSFRLRFRLSFRPTFSSSSPLPGALLSHSSDFSLRFGSPFFSPLASLIHILFFRIRPPLISPSSLPPVLISVSSGYFPFPPLSFHPFFLPPLPLLLSPHTFLLPLRLFVFCHSLSFFFSFPPSFLFSLAFPLSSLTSHCFPLLLLSLLPPPPSVFPLPSPPPIPFRIPK